MSDIEKERQSIINNETGNNNAQTRLNELVKSMDTDIQVIHIQESLNGDIDMTFLGLKFPHLREITFQEGKITSIIHFPKTLEIFKCPKNLLIELSNLPKSLLELDIAFNYFTTIDFSSTPNIEIFNATNNRLLSMNNLAASLKEIYVPDNKLTKIDLSGLDNLTKLNCSNNRLIVLENVPKSLSSGSGLVMENNPMLEIERTASSGGKTDTTKKIIYLDALYEYMQLKSQYENKKSEIKKKKGKKTEENIKHKRKSNTTRPLCINCKKPVGTIFRKTENNYIAICGDTRQPCNLDINLFTGIRQNFDFAFTATKQSMEHTKQLLVKQKMDTLFSYLNEKDSATQFKKRLEEYLGESKQYQDYLDFHNKFHNNMNRDELIKRQTEKVYEIKGRMKEALEEYKKDTFNKSAMNTAIHIHTTELIPEMLALRRLKYDLVEMNDDILNETEYPISSFVDQISQPEVIKFIMI